MACMDQLPAGIDFQQPQKKVKEEQEELNDTPKLFLEQQSPAEQMKADGCQHCYENNPTDSGEKKLSIVVFSKHHGADLAPALLAVRLTNGRDSAPTLLPSSFVSFLFFILFLCDQERNWESGPGLSYQ